MSGYASYPRDDAWRENVIAQFDESVRDIVARCRAAGVPIMLVKLGSNLRDCPPFKSAHRADLTPGAARAWQKEFIVFRQPIRATEGARLDLGPVRRHGHVDEAGASVSEVCDRATKGLAEREGGA